MPNSSFKSKLNRFALELDLTQALALMRQIRWLATFEATTLAAAPALAVLVAYLYQFGSYAALDVPFELIELTTPKIILSILALTFFFWFYTAVWADGEIQLKPRRWYGIVGHHFLINFVLSAVFWFRPYASFRGNALSMIFFTALFTSATLWARWISLSKTRKGRPVSLVTRSIFLAYCFAVVSLVSVISGFNNELKQKSRLIVIGKNMLFVGSYAGQHILKPYDPKTLMITKDGVILMSPEGSLAVERKSGITLSR